MATILQVGASRELLRPSTSTTGLLRRRIAGLLVALSVLVCSVHTRGPDIHKCSELSHLPVSGESRATRGNLRAKFKLRRSFTFISS